MRDGLAASDLGDLPGQGDVGGRVVHFSVVLVDEETGAIAAISSPFLRAITVTRYSPGWPVAGTILAIPRSGCRAPSARTSRRGASRIDLGLDGDAGQRSSLGVAGGDRHLDFLAHADRLLVQGQLDLVIAVVLPVREPEDYLSPEFAVDDSALLELARHHTQVSPP